MAHQPETNGNDTTDQDPTVTAGDDPEVATGGLEEDSAEPNQAGEDALRDQVGQLQEALLRAHAEMDNLHKRSEREQSKARRYAVDGLMRDLLPVLDSLDQGLLSAEQADGDRLREGMVLTRKLALRVLEQHGLEVLEPDGDRFDPNWHEAMAVQPSAEHEPDTVIEVVQKGFRLHDRLLRPARVVVARPPRDEE